MNSLFVNGEWVSGNGQSFESSNPASGEILWNGSSASKDDVDRAVYTAAEAFESWSLTSYEERLNILETFRDLVTERKEDLAQIISSETGKPYWESLLEAGAVVGKLGHTVNAYGERCPSKISTAGDAQSVLRFRPIGVMAVFGPFNLPVHLPNGHILPALLAGNTVVFKPSEQTPSCGQKLVELLAESGLPPGVINLVQGSRSTGEALVASQKISGVLFTGSYRVGRILHEKLAGRPEVILALEMGGNNPLIVWDVEDLQAAAYLTIQSSFITSGQRCVCARRLIISDDVSGDRFIEELCSMTSKIKYDDPAAMPEPFMGPVISAVAADAVESAYNDLVDRGAKILVELKRDSTIRALLSPAILDVGGIEVADEEVFGPLLQVIRVSSFNEAVQQANDTSFGLSAGLISDSHDLYTKFLGATKAGIVNWNRQITGAVSSNPFGGSGFSGNFRPGAYFAADYCAYPVSSIEKEKIEIPVTLPPGLNIE